MQDSLLSLNRLREEIDLEKSRAKRSDSCHDKDFEVCIRTKNNAWVIAKVTRGRELYMALEKAGETLLYASTAIEKFSNRYIYSIPCKVMFGKSLGGGNGGDLVHTYCDVELFPLNPLRSSSIPIKLNKA